MTLSAALLGALPLAAPTPAPAPADPTTTYVLMAGAGVFIVYVMMRMNRKNKKIGGDASPFAARGLAQQRQIEREMETLLVQLSDMCRQMTAQIDTRATKLEMLIADADERIARLKAENKAAPPRPRFGDDDIPPDPYERPRPVASPAVAAAPMAADRYTPGDRSSPADRQPAEPPPPGPPAEPETVPEPPPEPDDPHADVYRLADDGHDVRAIAAELGRPRGEIELILALRPRA